MNPKTEILCGLVLICAIVSSAQLAVTVSPVKIAGQKAIVLLALQNNFTNAVQSARAVCFLLDDQGKMIGQSSKWVIGQHKTGLEPKGEAIFDFVITSPQPFTTTNLTAKILFNRITLENGAVADVNKTVNISTPLP
jgi:opacity protein-like surface antigen